MRIFLLSSLLILPSLLYGATEQQIDQYVHAEMQARKIPGLSLAVLQNGKIILAKGYGFSNLEHNVQAKPETVYQSGSIDKQFAATAVMMLVEEGKIQLDDRINKYLKNVPEAWRDITVRHLLTHTSGVSEKLYDKINLRQDYTEEQIQKEIADLPLDFSPGEEWRYSNPGYVLVGILLHNWTGKFYGDYLQQRIFKPLGMTTIRIINEEDIIPNRAAGYRLVDGKIKNQEWVAPMVNTTADGSLYLTALDLAKWDAALYGESLITKESLDQMWTPVKLNNGKTHPYGFGWRIDAVKGHTLIEHSGSWQGFDGHIARYVGERLTIIVLTNLNGSEPDEIAHGIATLYNGELRPEPKKAD
ncbi:MAG TPA: serine hydrolase domain-containing protein [Acidobacteriota bacterium]